METQSEIGQDVPVRAGDRTSAIDTLINKDLVFGYGLLSVSFALFWTGEFSVEGGEDKWFSLFIAHYVLAVVYAVYLASARMYGIRKSWKKENLSVTIVLLNIFLVSAFALNRVMSVFEESVSWLCAYIGVASLALMSFHYYIVLPKWINKLQHLFLGAAALLFVYQAVFVARIYLMGTIGIVFFGIGAHVFVPITLIIASIRAVKCYDGQRHYRWLVAGLVIPILFVGAFIKEWNKRAGEMERISNQSVLNQDSLLPSWIRIGQWIPDDWITYRLLRSDLVYSTKRRSGGDWFFMPRTFSWTEARKHDPLVFISSHFTETFVPAADRIKIIQAISGGQHNAEERVWEGGNLSTSYIVSDVEIFPELRLAYTEKYLNINNSNEHRWRGNTQEAIYTFQLPEGSVVTSLSLWINDKEEKGILTSKQNAQKAYETIVGRERRDPSMIHWQEGNTVSVRVFPCTPQEERKFKIGVTTPLIEEEGNMVYKNIVFEGPDAGDAHETIRLTLIGNPGNFIVPSFFTADRNGDFVYDGDYDPGLQLEFNRMPLRNGNAFSFNGHRYSLKEHQPVSVQFDARDIFLDINEMWLHREIEFFRHVKNERNVFIYTEDRFVQITEQNWTLIDNVKSDNFSLFPFHLLGDAKNALVVTKGKRLSPYLRDIKESSFGEALRDYFVAGNKVHVFNLGSELPVYIRSLREFRAFDFASGNLEKLNSVLTTNTFPQIVEDENTVVLHDSGMKISRSTDPGTNSNAPDHLARLYAYNDIMRKVAVGYFTKEYVNDDLVNEAAMANVVSPVSSLIVLETAEDYKRFDISGVDQSLLNAARQHSGAVPEPHEWALIILFGLLVLFVTLRNTRFLPLP